MEAVDAGLRRYLLSVYNHVAAGLILTGVVAYGGAASGLYQRIFGTPLYWSVLFAPLALVLFLGYRVEKMSVTAARITF